MPERQLLLCAFFRVRATRLATDDSYLPVESFRPHLSQAAATMWYMPQGGSAASALLALNLPLLFLFSQRTALIIRSAPSAQA